MVVQVAAHPAENVVEMKAAQLAGPPSVFDRLQGDTIIVVRNLAEIHELGATLRRLAGRFGGAACADGVAELMRVGDVPNLETLAALYHAFRHLRDTRYLSCLFSDVIASLGLPTPLLIDCGFCRMVVPEDVGKAHERPELFGPRDGLVEKKEIEPMLQGFFWGNAHRDIDSRHYHYQINFWFPLHDLDQNRSLLLFPESYRRDVPQYERLTDLEHKDDWGFGRATQIPLNFGDTVVFHSQHLHASPSPAPGNRFTVELRAAAGCIDDNANIYRRVFWSLRNFQPPANDPKPAAVRAGELAELPSPRPSIDHALAATTAHAVLNRVFHQAGASLAAGYIHRDHAILDDAIKLDGAAVEKIIARLDELPCGEDAWILLARILRRQGHRHLAMQAVERVRARTQSYFWALEAGRMAADERAYDLAHSAFESAEKLAVLSEVRLDRYTPGMPPARAGGHTLQLLPATAQRAAKAFACRARIEREQSVGTTPTFDHRIFWQSSRVALASFENYDLVAVGGMVVGLPAGRQFHPEGLLNDGRGIAVGNTVEAVTVAVGSNLGRRLPQRLRIRSVFRPRSAVIARLFPEFAQRLVIVVKMWGKIRSGLSRIGLRPGTARGAGATIENLVAGRADAGALAKQAGDMA
jgi:hypothetical protein